MDTAEDVRLGGCGVVGCLRASAAGVAGCCSILGAWLWGWEPECAQEGWARVSMLIHASVWPHEATHTCVWLCMTIFVCVWPCVPVHGCIHLAPSSCPQVRQCLPLSRFGKQWVTDYGKQSQDCVQVLVGQQVTASWRKERGGKHNLRP